MKTTVVISTYNSPQPLRLCLLGFSQQTNPADQILIADDGSTEETAQLLRSPEFRDLPIEHVWHEDRGWTKPIILNLALAQATGDYVIFCDGDCIPRNDFIASHLRHARPKRFLSGKRVNVAPEIFNRWSKEDILSNRIFDYDFLSNLAEPGDRKVPPKARLLLHPGRWETALNWATYRYATIHGSNASAWLSDIKRTNGFDESFGYGSEDREFGLRLANAGVSSRWLKYSLCQIHLDHRLNHPSREQRQANRRRLTQVFITRRYRVEPGIDTALDRRQATKQRAA